MSTNPTSTIPSRNVPLTGSCLCGAIQLRFTRAPGPLMYCHCRQCRKAAGAPFQAVLPFASTALSLEDPKQHLRAYRATATKARYFCGVCGSPIYSQRDGASQVRVRAGILHNLSATLAQGGHIFCADAAAWDAIDDQLPRHPGIEPGRVP